MSTLISWLGTEDIKAAIKFNGSQAMGGLEDIGSIARILIDTSYEIARVVLLVTPDRDAETWNQVTEFLLACTRKNFEIKRHTAVLKTPQDFEGIYQSGKEAVSDVFRTRSDTSVYVNLSAGTRTMAAAWPLLQTLDPQRITILQASWQGASRVVIPGTLFLESENLTSIQRSRIGGERRIADSFESVVGENAVFLELKQDLSAISLFNTPVLLLGETGTGKEVFAEAIHKNYVRSIEQKRAVRNRALDPSNMNMQAVNCAAIPHELFESEMFGHERGAFTGAIGRKVGFFERAVGGTLFLDEVGELSLSAQSKLLRVLQEGKLIRVGGDEKIDVSSVRIIAATNRDLAAAIADGSFREDLYHRINNFPFYLPPLRERKDDIPLLVDHLMKEQAEANDIEIKVITNEAQRVLLGHAWPGNVRELNKVVVRMLVFSHLDGVQVIDADLVKKCLDKSLSSVVNTIAKPAPGFRLREYLDSEQDRLVTAAQAMTRTQTEAGDLLGLSQKDVTRYLKKARERNYA